MSEKLTVIIPIFNEEESLRLFFPKVLAYCQKNKFALIAVNDGSTDRTLHILQSFLTESDMKFEIVSHKLNKGYGGAIKSGILHAKSEYLITIDADGQHYLDDIEKLYSTMLQKDADLIIGSRKGQSSASLFRGFGKKVIRMIAKMLMKITVYDINSGMKIYRTSQVKHYLKLTPNSMSFSDVITLIFIYNRHLVLEESIRIKKRMGGKSTIGVRTAFEAIMEIINIIILFNPARIFIPISVVLFSSGLLWGFYFFIRGLGISIGGSTLLLAGLIIFLLGLIAEQLSALRKNQ